ncbi:hypothetical protein [Bradyrhizobium sp. dw_78]|uniref:hypothetical protein n=1 Tax=Bradyrhizobium sp. dw_78 TaxID=2719793 RepID=UPI001BD2B3CB|nr:hypothetical protein [Bradyrhizobium sp. dw_78]
MEPGRYIFKFGWLTVTAEDLAVWKRFPTAAFTLVRTPAMGADEADEELHLGAFEVREQSSAESSTGER